MAPLLAADRAAESDLDVVNYFEVHVQRAERWMIDCTSANAAEAMSEAEAIFRRGDVMAVKVVNERYNPRTDQSAARVVCKLEKPERKRRGGSIRMIAAPRVAPAPVAAAIAASDAPAVAAADAVLSPSPLAAELPRARPPPATGGTSPPTAPWLMFAWASLTLALGATALFVLLLVIG